MKSFRKIGLLGGAMALAVACGPGYEPREAVGAADAGTLQYPDQGRADSYLVTEPLVAFDSTPSAALDGSTPGADGGATDGTSGGDVFCTPTADEEDCGNAQDDDCNGLTDSQDPACQPCKPNAEEQCTSKHPGVCAKGSKKCTLGDDDVWAWSACVAQVEPGGEEVCDNTQDNDCDGKKPADDPDCHCNNGKRDKSETDVDCGGGACKTCAAGRLCNGANDCTSERCQAPTVSGGCQQLETSTRLYVQGGKLMVGCESTFGGGLETQRTITITGVTVSGGCQRLESATRLYVQSGRLMAGCQGTFGEGSEVRREVVLTGASVSGGCQALERSTRIYSQNGKLMVGCESTFGGGYETRKQLVITGPKTCQ